MVGSGEAAKSSSDANWGTLIAAQSGPFYKRLVVINNGAADAFIRYDGANSILVPAGKSWDIFELQMGLSPVEYKRAGATDVSGLYAYWFTE